MLVGIDEAADRIEGKTLRVAVAERPDLGQRALGAGEGIARRRPARIGQAHHLAERASPALGILAEVEAVAGGKKDGAVGQEQEAAAKMHLARLQGRCRPQRQESDEAVALEPGAGEPCAVRARGAVRVAEVDEAVLGKARVGAHVEEAALAAREHPRHAPDAGDRAPRNPPQAAAPLRHQRAAIGQEGDRPGVVEPAGDDFGPQRLRQRRRRQKKKEPEEKPTHLVLADAEPLRYTKRRSKGKEAAAMASRGMGARWGWLAAALLAATAATHLLMSLAHSLMVQGALADLGVDLPMRVRASGIARDLVGLAPTLGPVIAGALLVAFGVAALLRRRVGALLSALAFPLAGWAAALAILAGLRLAFGFSALAGARTPAGFLLMSLAGLAGGALFASLARRRS